MGNKSVGKLWFAAAVLAATFAAMALILIAHHPAIVISNSSQLETQDRGAKTRSLSSPTPIEISTADIDQGQADFSSDNAPVIADVGIAQSSPVFLPAASRAQHDQSDAEATQPGPGPIRVVAPVPTQQIGAAALAVRLASPNASIAPEIKAKGGTIPADSTILPPDASARPHQISPPIPLAIVTYDILEPKSPREDDRTNEPNFDRPSK